MNQEKSTWYCYICGKTIDEGEEYNVASYKGKNTDRVFLVCNREHCSKQVDNEQIQLVLVRPVKTNIECEFTEEGLDYQLPTNIDELIEHTVRGQNAKGYTVYCQLVTDEIAIKTHDFCDVCPFHQLHQYTRIPIMCMPHDKFHIYKTPDDKMYVTAEEAKMHEPLSVHPRPPLQPHTHGTWTKCPQCNGVNLQNIVEEETGCNETFCHTCKQYCYKLHHQYQMRENPLYMETRMSIILCEDCYTKYPVQDDQWPSRRWNKEHTDYIDLSGNPDQTLCKACGKKIKRE